jgi:hypothetical protein
MFPHPDQRAADAIAADDRLRAGRRLAAAVAVDHDVGCQQVDYAVEVAVADGGEEAGRELLAIAA